MIWKRRIASLATQKMQIEVHEIILAESMKIILTGGSGDLGQCVIPLLKKEGHTTLNFDIQDPASGSENFLQGSLLKPSQIMAALEDVNLVIHIAAWHGIHETRGWKTPKDLWDLNVDGTHHLIEACVKQGVSRMIHISSSSVSKSKGVYGHTKRVAEEIMAYAHHSREMDIVTLRPRAFIPPWNDTVYSGFKEWASRFWAGAVHIDDVAQATLSSVQVLASRSHSEHNILAIDRSPDFPREALRDWDENGPGSTFNKFYPEHISLAKRWGLDTSIQPNYTDISEAMKVLDYHPAYSIKNLMHELSTQ